MSQINLGVNTNATDRPMHIVVYREGDSVTLGGTNASNASSDMYDLTVQLARLTQRLDVAEAKIVELEKRMLVAPARSPWFGAAASGIAGVDVRRLSEAPPQEELLHSALFDKVLEKVSATKSPALYPQAVTSPDLEEEEEVEETPDMEAEEEETPDAEEAEEEEEGDAEEEEVEEEAVEYIPFEYKGVQYYRDDENQVYQLDEDGDLDDTAPIGVWNPEKQKVLKYR